MKRIKEEFLNKVEQHVPLKDLDVLEVGCGDGARSVDIASRSKRLMGIEPNQESVRFANDRQIPNAKFTTGTAEKLQFPDDSFDAVIFTLSLHHVPIDKMTMAIDEAVRVVRKEGVIIFLEPTETGSFFETELHYGAGDGDERQEKTAAYKAMENHVHLKVAAELQDETIFQFDSTNDFIQTMGARNNIDQLDSFLREHNFILNAERRINIFQPVKN